MRLALGLPDVPGIPDCDPLPPQEDRPERGRSLLETLYRNERARLLRFAGGRSAIDEAEDVVQRAFTRLAARTDLEALQQLDGYLRQTTKNILIDDARAAARIPVVGHVALDDSDGASADPVAMLEARDRLRRIEAAVARLKPLTRQIFLASRVDGFSHAEIAQQTGLSVKGVEKQMGKAIKQLGRHLRANG